MKDALGDRIKRYEAVSNQKLTPNSCVFIRLDGKNFHNWVEQQFCEKPFDAELTDAFINAALDTARKMQGFKLAYCQSDEVTFMLSDLATNETQAWFDNEVNKLVSITASMFTAFFNYHWNEGEAHTKSELAFFDARAFTVPRHDAPNVFVWRMKDFHRNSLQMLARSHFSHKDLMNKKSRDIHDMLHDIGINWANLEEREKNGTFIKKVYYEDFSKFEVFTGNPSYGELNELLGN